MRKTYRKMLCLSTLFGLVLFATKAWTVDCIAEPDCSSLGYSMNTTDCSGLDTIKCPFDISKVFCEKEQLVKTCDKIGDILYGDGTCAVNATKLVPDLVPVGVVFDTTNRLAIALTDVASDGSAKTASMYWSSSSGDMPNLENCTNSNTVITTCGTDGRANTDAILASTNNGTTYAANAVNRYQVSGCSKDFCKQGNWFLPSLRDLYTICNNLMAVNSTLSLLSSRGASQLKSGAYWSSTEHSSYYAWYGSMSSCSMSFSSYKYYSYNYVRPVVKF